jgi:hypothetical protein
MDDVIQHLVDISHGDAENSIAFRFEPSGLAAIGFVLMKRTVHFNRQAG